MPTSSSGCGAPTRTACSGPSPTSRQRMGRPARETPIRRLATPGSAANRSVGRLEVVERRVAVVLGNGSEDPIVKREHARLRARHAGLPGAYQTDIDVGFGKLQESAKGISQSADACSRYPLQRAGAERLWPFPFALLPPPQPRPPATVGRPFVRLPASATVAPWKEARRDLLRRAARARRRRLPAARRALQGQPERQGHHGPPPERTPQRPHPAAASAQHARPPPPPAARAPSTSEPATPADREPRP